MTHAEPGCAGEDSWPHRHLLRPFVTLVPGKLVVEADEFETDDPALRGETTISIWMSDTPAGTKLVVGS